MISMQQSSLAGMINFLSVVARENIYPHLYISL